ncbi:MAG: prenyltransferase/squalene oxidase repeat-containing protein, partial [Allosphingosinicella sp.]
LRAEGRRARIGGRALEQAVASQPRRNGSFAGRVNTTAFAVLGLRAAGRRARSKAVRHAVAWLAHQANPDGGFNFAGRGGPSGIDDTGAALQALAAGGRRHGRAAQRAARFIVRHQSRDGGFALIPGGQSNAQSTAWAVQGLLAAGRDPAKVHHRGAIDPMAFLRSLTAPSGEVQYSRTSRQTPVWVTGQALAALARKTWPLRRVPRAQHATTSTAATAAATPASTGTQAPTKSPEIQSLPPVATAAPADVSALAAVAEVPALGPLVSALMAR